MPRFRLITPENALNDFPELPAKVVASNHSENIIVEWEAESLNPDIVACRKKLNRDGITALCFPIRHRSSVFFDMDSTAIGQETIVELAACAGKSDEVERITEAAMAGELDFTEALQQRVAVLKGLPLSIYEEVRPRLVINDGLQDFSKAAIENQMKLFLVSGGFIPFAQGIAEHLNFSGYHANHLDENNGHLSGTVSGVIVDGDEKRHYLKQQLASLNLSSENAIAVGDGANDLAMMEEAGLAIGFKPKPILIEQVDGAIYDSHRTLIDVISKPLTES